MFFAIIMGTAAIVLGWARAVETRTWLTVLLASHALAAALALLILAAGPGLILSASRAKAVTHQSDPELCNILDEVSLAAGLPAPRLFLIESLSMNALAAGYGNRGAVVMVTSGLRRRLDRDALQAVLAYEVARIRDYDVHLMTVIAGFVGLTTLVVRALRESYQYLYDADEGPAALVVVWGVILLSPLLVPALAIAPLTGRAIQRAVSRKRQFLADVQAARLTRYPEALIRALEIISTDTEPMETASAFTAHLCLVAPILRHGRRAGGEGDWSAHPALQDRIARPPVHRKHRRLTPRPSDKYYNPAARWVPVPDAAARVAMYGPRALVFAGRVV